MNEYDYLIEQLGLLIGFLNVSNEDVYNQIKNHDQYDLGITIEQLYNNSYSNFQNHVCTSAVLLGFSHMEDFITKCIVKILTAKPDKNNYKVAIITIKEKGDSLIKYMAEKKSRHMTFSEKIDFIEKNIEGIDPSLLADIKFTNDIRNCLMHNNGVADSRINSKYHLGDKITLSSYEVNSFGLKARALAKQLWGEVENIHQKKVNL